MNANGNNSDIIARIQKLINMTVERGCTQAEAANAAAKVQELLQKYSLSLFDVETKTYGETVVLEDREVPFLHIPAWVWDMANAVSRGNDCKYFVSRSKGGALHRLFFVGHKSDAQVASYLYDTLSKRLWAMSASEGKRHGRKHALLAKFRWDFMRGAALEINTRLHRDREVFEASSAKAGAMTVAKAGAVQAWLEQQKIEIETSKITGPKELDHAGINAGREAGRVIEIRQGLEWGQSPNALDEDGKPLALGYSGGS